MERGELLSQTKSEAFVHPKDQKIKKMKFSDEQIKSLQSVFESEKKLEQKKKLQVAREVGLHPRQVSIWFQNRRARWKSKQIAHDHGILKAGYDDLVSKVESIKKEKESLLFQLQKLNEKLENPENGNNCIIKNIF